MTTYHVYLNDYNDRAAYISTDDFEEAHNKFKQCVTWNDLVAVDDPARIKECIVFTNGSWDSKTRMIELDPDGTILFYLDDEREIEEENEYEKRKREASTD